MTNIQKFREFAIIKKFCSKVQSEPGKGANFQKVRENLEKSGSLFENFHSSGKIQGKFRENIL